MDCKRSHKLLSAYLDGELGPEERTGMDAHIASCGECSRLLGELSDIKGFFKTSGVFEAPYGFSTRVLAATGQEGRARPGWRRRLVLAAEGFALAAVVLAGIVTGSLVSKTASPGSPAGIASRFSLEAFDAVPEGSVAGAYLAMTGVHSGQ